VLVVSSMAWEPKARHDTEPILFQEKARELSVGVTYGPFGPLTSDVIHITGLDADERWM